MCILDSSIFVVFILSFGTSIISYNYMYLYIHMYCLENENYVETIHIMTGCICRDSNWRLEITKFRDYKCCSFFYP